MHRNEEVGFVQKLSEFVYVAYAGDECAVSGNAMMAAEAVLVPVGLKLVAENLGVVGGRSVAELRVV